MKHWLAEELVVLRRLRERFLKGTPGADYWRSDNELALYDVSFGERIGWKWDAVLRELLARGWKPKSRHLFDWGCGSAIASRRVVAQWPLFNSITLYDRSPLAMRFAAKRLQTDSPQTEIRFNSTVAPGTLLLISHVLNELSPGMLAELLESARQAEEIIWVEAGTHADSRGLINLREQLIATGLFAAVAPCTHQSACGMLAAANERHWCHHFARPPSSAFQDGRWAEFSAELEIDLRSLPYSFLVLQRTSVKLPTAGGCSRVIGWPRQFKGHSKVLSCQAEGVCEFMLQKRDAPRLFRDLRRGESGPIYRWTLQGGKIAAGDVVGEQDD